MMSKKDLEEKRRKDEMEAAHVFEEFIETFQTPVTKSLTKVWVKAGSYKQNDNKNEESSTVANSLYKPLPKFKTIQDKLSMEHAQECARILPLDRKQDNATKKKSNLELFKEELQLLHKDREEKQMYKEELKQKKNELDQELEQLEANTTNLYVNNLNPKMTEQQLIELFGKYGPLGSVKIMWPRSEEERSRNKNCGFVAFMSRFDAERAIKDLNNKVVMNCELKVGWGKTVLLPNHPIYIPPSLIEFNKPSPNSGLPFNAQPPKVIPHTVTKCDDFLKQCVVKVVIPTDKTVLALIHRMIEFVVREGPLFEAAVMNREINNPIYRFLFDNNCHTHIYYRWKLYSILQGDSVKEWNTKEFRMFKGGSIWKPPMLQNYALGMPEQLIESLEKPIKSLKKSLSTRQRVNFETMIHKLSPERVKIAEGLVFCIDHSEACMEIAQCLCQSLEHQSGSLRKTIGRMYLMSDILCNRKIFANANPFKPVFKMNLPSIMKNMSDIYESIANEKKQIFYIRITRMLNAWLYWNVFPVHYLEYLYKIFINQDPKSQDCDKNVEEVKSSNKLQEEVKKDNQSDDMKTPEEPVKLPRFIPSKWETVDPDIIESQAMTTTKWSEMQMETYKSPCASKSKIITDKHRTILREIEMKVMEYQDELESNKKLSISHSVITKLVNEFRQKLIEEFEQDIRSYDKKNGKKRKGDGSPKRKYKKAHGKKLKYY